VALSHPTLTLTLTLILTLPLTFVLQEVHLPYQGSKQCLGHACHTLVTAL